MALSEFNGDKYQELEDEKSLLATMGIVVKELALKCPNDQELGKEVRELIKKYKLNTDVNG
jgi:Mor family transcriptional regulator